MTENTDIQTKSEIEVSPTQQILSQLIEDNGKLSMIHKENANLLKKLQKEIEKDRKKLMKNTKEKRVINQIPKNVIPEMQKFIAKEFPESKTEDNRYTRQFLMKLLSQYIKSKDIQNSENKKQWSGKEKTLKSIFKLEDEWYSFMQINGLLSRVIVN